MILLLLLVAFSGPNLPRVEKQAVHLFNNLLFVAAYFKFSVIDGQFSTVRIKTYICGTIFKSWLCNCALAKALIKLSYFLGLSTETRAPNQKK